MANEAKQTGPFDIKIVESLVALMSEHDLNEIYLREGTQHLRLRRDPSPLMPAHAPIATAHPVAAPAAHTDPDKRSEAPAPSRSNLIEIKSETVGTFFTQAKPGEPPFVKKGDRVTPNKVIGLVEVMKTYNEIQANCTGVIVDVLVENGKYVEFGEVLFRVDPS